MQADLWSWYEEPSALGCEVPTIGGPRGPATSHFLPYLSALQLMVPTTGSEAAAMAAAAAAGAGAGDSGCGAAALATDAAATAPPQLLTYPDGLDSWPHRMRPLVQWGEGANMCERVPMHSRLLELCGEEGERHPLWATRVADLHPYSW